MTNPEYQIQVFTKIQLIVCITYYFINIAYSIIFEVYCFLIQKGRL